MKLAMTCPPVYERYPVMGASRRGQTIWPYQSPRAFPRKRGNGEQGECINSIRAKALANLARSRLLNPIGGKADIGATIAQLLATVQRSIRRVSILYFFSVE